MLTAPHPAHELSDLSRDTLISSFYRCLAADFDDDAKGRVAVTDGAKILAEILAGSEPPTPLLGNASILAPFVTATLP